MTDTNRSQSNEEPSEEGSRGSNEDTTDGSVQSAPTEDSNQDPPDAARSSGEREQPPQRPRSARLQDAMARIQQAQLQEARSDRSAQDLDYQHLSSAYARLAEETTRTISGLRDRIRQLENICEIQNEELSSLRSSPNGRRRITAAEIKNSESFKSFVEKAKEASNRALENQKERSERQLARVTDSLRDARREAKDAAKELASAKKHAAQQRKNTQALESQSFRIRDMLSRTRVDLASCMKSKKALQDDLKVMTKTLARAEKDRATTKRELEKALNSQEVRKAEAAEASLKKEQVILEREKLRCENRIRSKVVEMELDRHKKESLLQTQADLKNALEVSKDDRAKGKRDRRVTSSTDRIWSSLRAVEMANCSQFPLLNSQEAAQVPQVQAPPVAQVPQVQVPQGPYGMAAPYAGTPTVPAYAPPPASPRVPFGLTTPPSAQAQQGAPNQDSMAHIVATMLTALSGRGTEYTNNSLPEGVEMVQDQQSGQIYYRSPPGPDGRVEYFQNRDEIFRKPTAAAANTGERRRLFGSNLWNTLLPDDRRVRPRVSPPDLPRVTVPAVPPAVVTPPSDNTSVEGDTRSLATQPPDPANENAAEDAANVDTRNTGEAP